MAGGPTGPVAIIAGAGLLPVALAQHLKGAARPYRILALRGFADRELVRQAHEVVDILDVKGIITHLDGWQPSAVVLAGAVNRPKPSALLGSYSLIRNMGDLKEMVARGDDGLLRGAVSLLEGRGFTVIGAHDILPEILSGEGVFGNRAPSADEDAAIRYGFGALRQLAPYDIGQALALSNQHILAIEGPEGTDRMLRRVAGLRKKGLFSRKSQSYAASALVKTAKAQQDLRVDMPVIGPRTVREVAAAGLSGIAIGAGKTLILNREETIREANRHNLFLVGFCAE